MQSDSIAYRVVYDAADAGYPDWWIPAIGIGMCILFAFRLVRRWKTAAPLAERLVNLLGIPFGAFLVVVFGGSTYSDHVWIRGRLASGRFLQVEGEVSNYSPGDWGDHRAESWEIVSGGKVHRYKYVRSVLSPGFRKAAVHGGPIRPGLRVRIADVDGYIARLEIAR